MRTAIIRKTQIYISPDGDVRTREVEHHVHDKISDMLIGEQGAIAQRLPVKSHYEDMFGSSGHRVYRHNGGWTTTWPPPGAET